MDAGIVSQNISLFCSGTGLATYPRQHEQGCPGKGPETNLSQDTHALSSGRI